jgi:hypothetical protein
MDHARIMIHISRFDHATNAVGQWHTPSSRSIWRRLGRSRRRSTSRAAGLETDRPQVQPYPNTPSWVNHIAFEVPSMDALLEGERRLEAADVDVLGLNGRLESGAPASLFATYRRGRA